MKSSTVIEASTRFRKPIGTENIHNFVMNRGFDPPVYMRKAGKTTFSQLDESMKSMILSIFLETERELPICTALSGFWYDDKGCCSLQIQFDPELAEFLGYDLFEGWQTESLVRETSYHDAWMFVEVRCTKSGFQ